MSRKTQFRPRTKVTFDFCLPSLQPAETDLISVKIDITASSSVKIPKRKNFTSIVNQVSGRVVWTNKHVVFVSRVIYYWVIILLFFSFVRFVRFERVLIINNKVLICHIHAPTRNTSLNSLFIISIKLLFIKRTLTPISCWAQRFILSFDYALEF